MKGGVYIRVKYDDIIIKVINFIYFIFLSPNLILVILAILFESIPIFILFLLYLFITFWVIKAHKPSRRYLNNTDYLIHFTDKYDDIYKCGKIYPTRGFGNYSKLSSKNLFGFRKFPRMFQFIASNYKFAIKIKLTEELKNHLYVRYIDGAILLSVSDMSKEFLNIKDLEYECIKDSEYECIKDLV